MSAATIQQIAEILPTLASDEQESVLDYIRLMRGGSVLADLSSDDKAELLRRAATIDPSTTVPLDQVIAGARQRLAGREK